MRLKYISGTLLRQTPRHPPGPKLSSLSIVWSLGLPPCQAAHSRAGSQKYTKYTVKQLLHCFLTSSMIRNAAHVRDICKHICEVIWPGLFQEVLETKLGPSASTVRRAQALVDVAMLLHSQTQNRHGHESSRPSIYRWGWSDASPIKGREWFISKHIACKRSDLVLAYLAATALALDRPNFQHTCQINQKHRQAQAAPSLQEMQQKPFSSVFLDDVCFDGEAPESLSENVQGLQAKAEGQGLSLQHRGVLASFLRRALQMHVHVPTSVGLGASNLTHKTQALLHSIGMECSTAHDLKRYLQGVVSWTSDLGVESGLSQVHLRTSELLPDWWCWQWAMDHDGEGDQSGCQPDASQDCSCSVFCSHPAVTVFNQVTVLVYCKLATTPCKLEKAEASSRSLSRTKEKDQTRENSTLGCGYLESLNVVGHKEISLQKPLSTCSSSTRTIIDSQSQPLPNPGNPLL